MNNNPSRPLAYSLKDACAVSSLGRTTLYTHINSGRLKVRLPTFFSLILTSQHCAPRPKKSETLS